MLKNLFITILIIMLVCLTGCGKTEKEGTGQNNQPTAQNNHSEPTQQESAKAVDEKTAVSEWNGKLETIAGRYLSDWKALWEPSMQLLSKQVSNQDELYQNHKTVYQNLNNLSNKLINYEMMYREIRIPNEIPTEKKEQMLQTQNLFADAVKRMREAVDVMKMMAMKSNFPQSEQNKFTTISTEASTMFNNANTKMEQIKREAQ